MNASPRDIEQRCWKLLEPVLAVDGYELVEVEYAHDEGRWVLRIYIDKPEGVTIEDTVMTARDLGVSFGEPNRG